MLKEELRRQMRVRKQAYGEAELRRISAPIVERLHDRLGEARVVLLYYSLPDEVYTHELIDVLVSEGKSVLLPKVVSDSEMELHRYQGSESLCAGRYGIMEPIGPLFTDYEQIDVAVVPGIAFDSEGHRLGRGRGYYDRFFHFSLFTFHLSLKKIGLCFPFQLVDLVPTDSTDIPMDEVLY